jgi:hypothetical protein
MTLSHRFAPVKRICQLALMMLVAISGAAMAVGQATAAGPWIQSDQPDYSPAQTVTLTGGNWQPDEMVQVTVADAVGQTWSLVKNVPADSTGAFAFQFQLPDWYIATYQVTATGQT